MLPSTGSLAFVLCAYFVTAAAAMVTFGAVTPIWFANAIMVAFLLRCPLGNWPGVLACAGLTDALAIHLFGAGPMFLLAGCDVLEISLAATLLHFSGGVQAPVFQGKQIARVILVALLVPALSGLAGGAVFASLDGTTFAAGWRTWYSASALGLLLACPLLLSWMDGRLRSQAFAGLGTMDVLLLLVQCGLLLLLMLSDHPATIFLSFPVVFLMSWRYGLLGVTCAIFVTAAAGIATTFGGQGAIIRLVAPVSDLRLQMESLQVYLAAVMLSSMPLTVLLSQQRDLAERVRIAGEARGEFLAAMSHEIRTPLTGVLGMADLLAAEELNERQRGFVSAIRASGRHLLSVVNDILDFSRIESGRLDLERVDFSLPDSLEAVRSLVHPMAVERGLALHFSLDADVPGVVKGDPLRLRQVLLNLVSNAIKFTERGSVELRVSRGGDPASGSAVVRFEVRDTGVGIDPAKLEKLFAPFTQADRSISRQHGGSGLGLAISKRLVDAMGGQIGAVSHPGEGSIFHVELPLALGDASLLPGEAEDRPSQLAPSRILVAEDVEINRQILAAALSRQGHELVFATNGAEALGHAETGEYDLVLMDVQMPVMDGVEATRRIRKLPGTRGRIPIIGLTANVMTRERDTYLSAGMDACLMKPIDWEQLSQAIETYGGMSAREGPPSATLPAPAQADREPLLDDRALDGLARMAAPDELAMLILRGIDGYEGYCDRMRAPGTTAEEIYREAHKLKGSSGTLGMRAISVVAQQIEDACEQQQPTTELVDRLRRLVAATRAELVARGLIPADALSTLIQK